MSMKRTDLVKLQAIKVREAMKKAPTPERFGGVVAAPLDRREQRRLDQAAGLIPFACKLNAGVVQQLRDLAQVEDGGLNALVGRLIASGLAQTSSSKPSAPKAVAKKAAAKKATAATPATKPAVKQVVKKAVKKAPAEKAEAKPVAAKKSAAKKVAAKKVAAPAASKSAKPATKKKVKAT